MLQIRSFHRTYFSRYMLSGRGMANLEKPISSVGPDASKKRFFGDHQQQKNKKRQIQKPGIITGSAEEILNADVCALLYQIKSSNLSAQNETSLASAGLPELFAHIDLTIDSISSTGDGLARSPDGHRVYVVPFTAPGDIVRAKIIRHDHSNPVSFADFLEVLKASPYRDQSLIKCRYFASCSGCQFQMLPYSYQLSHKKNVLEKAYKNFSGLESKDIPDVGDTISSPLQYGYRTKLTPHFDGPPGGRRARKNGERAKFEQMPPIGFMKKGTRKTLDIEDCPIGTKPVQLGMARERARVAKELNSYKRGATLLLRESTTRVHKSISNTAEQDLKTLTPDTDIHVTREEHATYAEFKTCITDSNAVSTEYVSSYIFTNPAGAFFQNNNSILPKFTDYIRSVILPAFNPPSEQDKSYSDHKITNLIDAYSGSGLFTITLSSLFQRSVGIDISSSSIACATNNARLNNLHESSVEFIAADANALFAKIQMTQSTTQTSFNPASPEMLVAVNKQKHPFLPENTVVILDPPRKGCDESFLRQLLDFGPERIVYVSCNVHSQARDVGWIVRNGQHTRVAVNPNASECNHEDAEPTERQLRKYEIESLRGFDFFPQTGHVEGVAVLRRIHVKN